MCPQFFEKNCTFMRKQMQKKDNEIFSNWTNSSNSSDQLQFRQIQARMVPILKKNAYNISEIEEILISEGFKENLVKEALRIPETKTEKEVKTSSTVIPKSYADLSGKFEQVLANHGPRKFVQLMTQGENPLMKVSNKQLDAFQRFADTAYNNPTEMPGLHAFMKPSIISELAENVCRARKIRQNCRVAEKSNGEYEIQHGSKKIVASFKPMKSSSEKFASSNYQHFQFPDEYIILAYEEASPYSQIKKDLGM